MIVRAGGSPIPIPISWPYECGITWRTRPRETAASQTPVASRVPAEVYVSDQGWVF